MRSVGRGRLKRVLSTASVEDHNGKRVDGSGSLGGHFVPALARVERRRQQKSIIRRGEARRGDEMRSEAIPRRLFRIHHQQGKQRHKQLKEGVETGQLGAGPQHVKH